MVYKKFTGKIFITELDGNFLYGYTVDNGKIVHNLIKDKDTQATSKNSYLIASEALEKSNCEFTSGGCQIGEAVVTGSRGGSSINNIDVSYVYNFSWNGGTSGSRGFSYENTNSWDYGDGSIEQHSGSKCYNTTTQKCECINGNKVEDSNGNCV